MEALQRDLHLSAEQAQTRLLNEIRLTPIAGQLRRRLGIRFAGSWLQGPTAQTLVVATTNAYRTLTHARTSSPPLSRDRAGRRINELSYALSDRPRLRGHLGASESLGG